MKNLNHRPFLKAKLPGLPWLSSSWESRLPVQGIWVPSLLWEDSTCPGATKWPLTRMQQLLNPNSRARAQQQEKPLHWEAHAPQGRVAPLTATRENLHAARKTQCSQKKKKLNCCIIFLYLSSREGNGNQLQYSCPGKPINRGAWKAIQSKRLQRVRRDLGTKQLGLLSSTWTAK